MYQDKISKNFQNLNWESTRSKLACTTIIQTSYEEKLYYKLDLIIVTEIVKLKGFSIDHLYNYSNQVLWYQFIFYIQIMGILYIIKMWDTLPEYYPQTYIDGCKVCFAYKMTHRTSGLGYVRKYAR